MNNQKPAVHKPIVKEAAAALLEIFVGGAHADKVIERCMRQNRKWGSRDRRQFAEIVYDIVRWWRLLLVTVLKADLSSDISLTDCEQLVSSYLNGFDLPSLQAKATTEAIRQSIPDELFDLLKSELGADVGKILTRLNQRAPQFLRVNTLKATRDSLGVKLRAEEIQTAAVESVATALRLAERKNVFITGAFKQGFFEMQDAGSQLIAPLLGVKPGDRVIDACAGAGGKTLQLAMLMKNQGRVIAMDIHQRKLDELTLRSRRAGASIIEPRLIESTKVIKRLHESADHVLLDVPCSGLGVLRRYPDTKFKFKAAELDRLADTQRDILSRYSLMAKVGGSVVYATCSILPSENSGRVREFLEANTGAGLARFELEEELHVSPLDTDFDGFYAARLRRKSL